MEFVVHVHYHQHRTPQEAEAEQFTLAEITQLLMHLKSQGEQIMAGIANINTELDALEAQEKVNADLEDSAINVITALLHKITTLLNELSAAIANNDPDAIAAAQKRITGVVAAMTAKKEALAAAIASAGDATTVVVSSLNPSTVSAGSADVKLAVSGNGFDTESVVQTDGASKTTTFVSANQVTAVLPAVDVATAKTIAVSVLSSDGTSTPTVPLTVV
jgi:hypothetical protein